MIRTLLIVSGVLCAGGAFAQTPYSAAEMTALLAKGLVVSSSDLEGGKRDALGGLGGDQHRLLAARA